MPLLATLRAMAAAQPQPSLLVRVIGGGFFGACCVGALAVCLFCAYESIALTTGMVPTISVIVGGWASEHPVWTPVITLVVGIVVGILICHFTGWRP